MKNYSIVGMEHQGTIGIVAALEPGVAVTLVREPENKFDKNAIAVWVDGQRVGYIPKAQNVALAAHIDATGNHWAPPAPVTPGPEPMAADAAVTVYRAIEAKFVRSPNSGYPMVEA